MHLTALRALGDDVPVNLKLVVEGSEEQGTGGLEAFVPTHPDLLARRRDPGLRHRQRRRRRTRPPPSSLRGMVNVVVHRRDARRASCTPACSAAPAPDALAALVAMLATLRDAHGNTTVDGLDNAQTWTGRAVPRRAVPQPTPASSTASTSLGDGTVSDMLWARPAVTVLGIDCPPVVGSAAAIVPRAARAAEPAHPAGHRPPTARARADRPPPRRRALGRARSRSRRRRPATPFRAATDGPAYDAMGAAMQEAYGTPHDQPRAGRLDPAVQRASPRPTPTPRSS